MSRILLALICILIIASNVLGQVVNFKKQNYDFSIPYTDYLTTGDFDANGFNDVAALTEYGIVVLLHFEGGATRQNNYHDFRINASGGIAAADFNNDGYLDLVYTVYDSTSFAFNNGDGTFNFTKPTLSTGPSIGYIVSNDFNVDGKPDLAIANPYAKSVFVFLNDPKLPSGFSSPNEYKTGAAFFLQTGHLNDDPFPDLVSLDADASTVTILTNNGDGTYVVTSTINNPSAPQSVSISDFDGDGQSDLVVGCFGVPATLILYKNLGTSFQQVSTESFTCEFLPYEFLATEDINSDGHPDIVFTNWDDGTVSILINDKSGGFLPVSSLKASIQPRSLKVTDVNNDALPDLIIADYSTIRIGINQGDGSFYFHPTGAGSPISLTHGDFNKDGKLDVAAVNNNDNDISVFLSSTGNEQLEGPHRFACISKPSSIQTADVVGTTDLDLIVGHVEIDSVSIYEGNGDGTFSLSSKFNITRPYDHTIADFNADGKLDIAVLGSPLTLLMNTGSGFTKSEGEQFYNEYRIASGDLNGDFLPDLVVATENNFNNLYMLLNIGEGQFTAPTPLTNQRMETKAISISDFTFDGIPDIGFTTANDFRVLVNNGQGGFTTKVYGLSMTESIQITTGDYTGNGKQDVAFLSRSSANVSVLAAKDETTEYYEPVRFNLPGYLLDIQSGNFNNDDKDDLVISSWPYHYLTIMTSLPRLEITVHDANRLYGDTNPAFTSILNGWPGAAEPEVELETPATLMSPVGLYDITPVISDSVKSNFALIVNTGVLTINPAPLVITALDTTRLMGKANPIFQRSIVGLKNNDYFPTYQYSFGVEESPPGQYPIKVSENNFNYNYEVTVVDGVLTILSENTSAPHPNPSSGDFQIYSLKELSFYITDISGHVVYKGLLKKGNNQIKTDLITGIYLIVMEDGSTHRILITK